jgi:hypothetical protein
LTPGVAWADVKNSLPIPSDVQVYRSWPGKGGSNPKVPSAYSYDISMEGKRQWGYDVDVNCQALRWTKLELEPLGPQEELEKLEKLVAGLEQIRKLHSSDDYGLENGIPQHLTKEPEHVVSDYLGEVAREYYSHITKQTRYLTQNVQVDLAITHPAKWSYEAQNKTFRAVTSAFNSQMFPNRKNIYMMSEPEACALDTVQDMLANKHNTLIPVRRSYARAGC